MVGLAVCRSTGPVDRGRSRSTDVHRTCTQQGWWAGRPGGRPSRELCSLEMAPVDRAGRPAESSALCIQSRSIGPVDRRLNGQKDDRWPVDRPVDRKGNSALSSCQRADSFGGYKYPPFELVFNKLLETNFSHLYKYFNTSF